jgi:hypothetical protein
MKITKIHFVNETFNFTLFAFIRIVYELQQILF